MKSIDLLHLIQQVHRGKERTLPSTARAHAQTLQGTSNFASFLIALGCPPTQRDPLRRVVHLQIPDFEEPDLHFSEHPCQAKLEQLPRKENLRANVLVPVVRFLPHIQRDLRSLLLGVSSSVRSSFGHLEGPVKLRGPLSSFLNMHELGFCEVGGSRLVTCFFEGCRNGLYLLDVELDHLRLEDLLDGEPPGVLRGPGGIRVKVLLDAHQQFIPLPVDCRHETLPASS